MTKRYKIILIFVLILTPSYCLIADTLYKNGDKDHYLNTRCQSSCHKPEEIKKIHIKQHANTECAGCHSHKGGGYYQDITRIKYALDHNNRKDILNKMITIPGSETVIGSNERWDDEGPMHKVYIDTFKMDKYELSNSDYKVFVEIRNWKTPNHWKRKYYNQKEYGMHPVTYVSWFDADAFCKWAGKRLPTEFEWEKGARGKEAYNYPWGNSFNPDNSNNPIWGSTGTMSIFSYENGKSPYGFYNMSGNVWEWTSSWYKPYPGNTKHKRNYGETHKVLKGGSWYNCESYDCGISAPTFNRASFEPDVKSNSFGFRCAM